MKTTKKKITKEVDSRTTSRMEKTKAPQEKKSKIALFWEKYPKGVIEIVDMDAILK
ncbi:MAG: hypothetical protein LLF81_06950 [Porphyromonadaceae bacterium]|nr:hypothetical protein [Porphyromonadaceae bacterium]